MNLPVNLVQLQQIMYHFVYSQDHSDTNFGCMNDEPGVHNHECDGILKDNHK